MRRQAQNGRGKPGIRKSLLTSLYWISGRLVLKKRKKGSPVSICDSCYSQAPFPYRREKMSLREGKFRTSDLTRRSIATHSHLPWHVVALNPPTDWEKESNFSRESPFQRSHYLVFLVCLSGNTPIYLRLAPSVSLGALFVQDEPTHMASTSQGKLTQTHAGNSPLPRYSLDVGHQNASWSLWSLK